MEIWREKGSAFCDFGTICGLRILFFSNGTTGPLQDQTSTMRSVLCAATTPEVVSHGSNEEILTQLILEEIRTHAALAMYDEDRVVKAIIETKSRESLAYLALYQQELKSAEERLLELENVIRTLYELQAFE